MKMSFSDDLGSFTFEGDADDLRPFWRDVYRLREEERYRKEARTLSGRIRQFERDMHGLWRAMSFRKELRVLFERVRRVGQEIQHLWWAAHIRKQARGETSE